VKLWTAAMVTAPWVWVPFEVLFVRWIAPCCAPEWPWVEFNGRASAGRARAVNAKRGRETGMYIVVSVRSNGPTVSESDSTEEVIRMKLVQWELWWEYDECMHGMTSGIHNGKESNEQEYTVGKAGDDRAESTRSVVK
jgi:hypothetical protein